MQVDELTYSLAVAHISARQYFRGFATARAKFLSINYSSLHGVRNDRIISKTLATEVCYA